MTLSENVMDVQYTITIYFWVVGILLSTKLLKTVSALYGQFSNALLKYNLIYAIWNSKVIFMKIDVNLSHKYMAVLRCWRHATGSISPHFTGVHLAFSNLLGWFWNFLSVYAHVVYLELCHHQVWSNWWKSLPSPVRPSLSRLRGNGGRMGACILI